MISSKQLKSKLETLAEVRYPQSKYSEIAVKNKRSRFIYMQGVNDLIQYLKKENVI